MNLGLTLPKMNNEPQVPPGPPIQQPVTPDEKSEPEKEGSKRSPLFKILLASMGILGVFVAAELVYYFKFANTQQAKNSQEIPVLIDSPVSQPTPEESPIPTPPPFVSKTIYFDKEQNLLSLAHSFGDKSDMITSFKLNLGVIGQVVSNQAEEYDKNNAHYVWKLGLTNSNVQQLIIIRFTSEELQSVSVTRITPTGEQKIALKDIEDGNLVQLTETDDFLDNSPSSKLELRVW